MFDKEQAELIAKKFADIVAREFNPKQVLFFGSYLYGVPEENSDIDVAVVFDKVSEPEDWWKAAARMERIRWENKDIIDVEPHLLEYECTPKSFSRHVQDVGKVLYQR